MRKLFGLSIVLNLILVGVLAYQFKPAPPNASPSTVVEKTVTNVLLKKIRETTTKTEPGKVVTLDWHSVESADFKEYIKNLRSVNCPEETIRDIIMADVNKMFASRRQALYAPTTELNYWEADNQNDMWRNRKFQRESQAMEREKRDLIKELLGVDANKEMQRLYGWGRSDRDDKLLAFLPQEKSDAVKALREKYQDLSQKIYEMKDSDSDENQAQLRKFKEQKKAELAQLLTPDELQAYNVRLSDTAQSLRYSMNGFNPTEEEFLTLFKIRQSYDEQPNTPYDPDDEAANKKRSETYKKMEDEIKTALPQERYTEYKRANDYEYQELRRFAQEQDLPTDAATKIYEIKKTVEDEARKVRSDRNLSSDQRKTAMKAMQTETEKTLTEIMGNDPKMLKRYKSNRGWWIRNLGN